MAIQAQLISDHAHRTARRVAALIARADALLVTAGAGMSVDSGLPDFCRARVFWNEYPPLEQMAQRVHGPATDA